MRAIAATETEAQLEHEHDRLAALAALDLVSGDSLDLTLHLVAEAATSLLPASTGASVVLWDPARQTFATSASTVPGPGQQRPARWMRTDGGASRWILDHQRPLIVPDVRHSSMPANPMTRAAGVRAFAGVPIGQGDIPLGVLFALDAFPRAYGASDISFLETLAGRAASAIVNARLLEEIIAARDRAQAVGRVGEALIAARDLPTLLQAVAEGLTDAADADCVLLTTIHPEGHRVTERLGGSGVGGPLAAGDEALAAEFAGRALRKLATVISPQEGEPAPARRRQPDAAGGSVVTVPLLYEGRAHGAITVVRRPGRRCFDPIERSLIEAMAKQATIAIQHTRLNEATRRALGEVRALFELTSALSVVADVDEVCREVVAIVANKTGADCVALRCFDLDDRRVERSSWAGPRPDLIPTAVPIDELLEGLTGWVLRYCRPAYSPDGVVDDRESERVRRRRAASGRGATIVVPLMSRGTAFGVLSVANRRTSRDFDTDTVELVAAMGGQAAASITDASLLAEVQRMAVTDALTGASTRRHLLEIGQREVDGAERYRRPLAAIMLDVDHFKAVNDRYGHGVGDQVLAAVVDRGREAVRDVDVFGRYGGEEFAVILPEAGLGEARHIAERIRTAVAASPVTTTAGPVRVTVSAGIAALECGAEDLQRLLDRADQAMLRAKRAGRDAVCG